MLTRRHFLGAGAATLFSPPWSLRAATHSPFQVLEPKPATAPLTGQDKPPVPVWAYQGLVPGPEIRVRRGERVRVRLKNSLPQATSIHWHGIRIDNAMDGVSGLTQDAVAPGDTFEYSFIAPDAGTFWYHPHNKSWEQMARGLYGMLIVDEDTPPDVDRDLSFVADDWLIGKDGKIDEKSFGNLGAWSHGGRLGNWLTVNGLTEPDIPVRAGERIRLRLVNTANARILAFNFAPLAAQIIALDGQPVPPSSLGPGGLTIAPAQRVDVIIDIDAQPGETIPIWEVSTRQRLQAAQFVVSREPAIKKRPPEDVVELATNKLLTPTDPNSAQHIDLVMEGGAMGGLREGRIDGRLLSIEELIAKKLVWAFNGDVGRQVKPLATIARGRTAIINMVNKTAFPHAMHLHGFHFRVIERNGKPVWRAPWRDTELVGTDEQVRIAFVADNPGKWLFHCHMLEHQAAGMLTWLVVT
ncbi:MAG: multicopper oxidase family protein [Alphaproteobacteria bacterium]|jgi:FtsP/CotA-like multicopper oxidase with cupredoxin domain|nr:multicopper oxidase family protein [Alphaproteobacteria bacterium]MBT7941912.1 multicopper oxidase family protein [Alphaproteobacteria bacterium]